MGWAMIGGQEVEFRSGNTDLGGYLTRPARPGRVPAVLMLHGIHGASPGTRRAAERLGDEGYAALVVYWQSREKDPPDAEIMDYLADARAFLARQEFVDADRLAVAGYCRGGGLAYLALEHHSWLKAGIAMHGFPFYAELDEKKPRHPFDLADRIQAPLLILHGAADQTSPVENVYRMAQHLEELGKEYVLKVYGRTGHAFTLPDGGAYNPIAGGDSWREVVALLDRTLGGAGVS